MSRPDSSGGFPVVRIFLIGRHPGFDEMRPSEPYGRDRRSYEQYRDEDQVVRDFNCRTERQY